MAELHGNLAGGKPSIPFMHFGYRIRIEMCDAAGSNIFGTIAQQVVPGSAAY